MKYLIRLLSLSMILWAGSEAFAHGTSLKVDKKTAAPGETVTVKGEGIGSNAAITIILQGVAQDYSLGEAQGNEHGVFEKQVALPGDVRPGNYTVIAAAGGSKAAAKLAVTTGHDSESMPGMEKSGHGEAGMDEADAGPMEIERSATTAEKVVAWAMVLASAMLGVGLLFREKQE